MASAIGHSDQYYDLKRYLLIGSGDAKRPYQTFWDMYEDPTRAQYTAIAWQVCGFATRVIDLKSGVTDPTLNDPSTLYRYENLASVQAVVPNLTNLCLQEVPANVPWPISLADFQNWLVNFSQAAPTWNPPASVSKPVIRTMAVDTGSMEAIMAHMSKPEVVAREMERARKRAEIRMAGRPGGYTPMPPPFLLSATPVDPPAQVG